MQHARREREALLPAAGERAGELIAAIRKAQPIERRLHRRGAIRDGVDPSDEIQVFADRQPCKERTL